MSTFVYKFKSEADKIDFQRICDENMGDGRLAFVVTFGSDDTALLFVHSILRRKFKLEDNIMLRGSLLCKHWGWGSTPRISYRANKPVLSASTEPLFGWRWDIISPQDIKAVKEQLNAIMQERKTVTVKVHDLTEKPHRKKARPRITPTHEMTRPVSYRYCDLSRVEVPEPAVHTTHAPYKYLFGDRLQYRAEVYTVVGVDRSCGRFIYEVVPDNSLSPQYFSEEVLDKVFERLPEKLPRYKIGDFLENAIVKYEVIDVFRSQHSDEYMYKLGYNDSVIYVSEEEIDISKLELRRYC